MAGVKVQNVEQQFIAVRDNDGNLVAGKKISITTNSQKLSSLLTINKNAEYVLIDFFGNVWLRFDGQTASEKNGHKFTADDHPVFSVAAVNDITVISADGVAVEAFVSQLGGGC